MFGKKSIWIVSREYAGIAEAGGVKNVTASLAEGLHNEGFDVSVFIPLYGCTVLDEVTDFTPVGESSVIRSEHREYTVRFARGNFKGVRFVFIMHSGFSEKAAVYTYTEEEERINPRHVQGSGHEDSLLLNVLFQKGVLEYGLFCVKNGGNALPDIIHCQDATAALVPFIARNDDAYRSCYKDTAFAVTIHNAGNGYRHEMPGLSQAASLLNMDETLFNGALIAGHAEPYLLAEKYAALTTVSPWYAKELCDPENEDAGALSKEFAGRGIRITGITNGIEYEKYDPRDTAVSMLPVPFNPAAGDFKGKYACRTELLNRYALERYGNLCSESGLYQYGFIECAENAVFFSYHGRIVHQKGTNILAEAAQIVMERNKDTRFIVTGQGATELEKQQASLALRFPGRYLYLRGYNRPSARLCVAVSDFIVLPSIFEPCGLEDLIAQIYGTLPVAHACGGLQKIEDGKTGFLYQDNSPHVLAELLLDLAEQRRKNPAHFEQLAVQAALSVQIRFSWKKIIKTSYIPFYEGLRP
ncbi:glycogen/starch synthase [Treponema sp. HNW]|uniref:glycogen synthase n=1 Tax=Treponema sp. HNW TaxID=3116654 RepID=UPI003D142994